MAKGFDVVTIGSAVHDLFILANEGRLLPGPTPDCEKLLAFEYGSKIPVSRIQEEIGGAGVNVAAGLVRLGVKAAPCISIGDDDLGKKMLRRIRDLGLDTRLVRAVPNTSSDRSIILVEPVDRDRVIFRTRDAGENVRIDGLFECKTKWVHVSSLPSGGEKILDKILKLKRHQSVDISFNPGRKQLAGGIKKLKDFLKEVSLLFMNWDEALELAYSDKAFRDENPKPSKKKVLGLLKKLGPQVVVITLGRKGSIATDGYYRYQAPTLSPKRVEVTGAGDAFSSGFLASWIYERGDIKRAMSWGSVNAGNVILYFGASKGLLRLNEIKRKINDVIVNNLIEEKPV